MATDTQELIQELTKQIQQISVVPASSQNVGTVTQVGDGVAEITGLSEAMYGEMVEFGGGIYGLVLNLLENKVNAIINYRKQHGLFSSLEELAKIHLINDEALFKIKPYLKVD